MCIIYMCAPQHRCVRCDQKAKETGGWFADANSSYRKRKTIREAEQKQRRNKKNENRRYECRSLILGHCVICVVSRKSRISSARWWRRRIVWISQGFKFIPKKKNIHIISFLVSLYVYALWTRGYYSLSDNYRKHPTSFSSQRKFIHSMSVLWATHALAFGIQRIDRASMAQHIASNENFPFIQSAESKSQRIRFFQREQCSHTNTSDSLTEWRSSTSAPTHARSMCQRESAHPCTFR